ncbi:Nuclear polyadenylated RNA-binding protein [Melia azedarach]|uniref:Nuclear polyadenylated RNA-binding protein n=1 Tax=Melia azedarach TaxID=155640 RepID=A0ACC1YLU5_MELAZ|nr:Nuclear polyadenylated RNA-binding protein [Melia azedarach]
MRVLFCKIHCPSFICFCKPTSHIYTPGPLKLENSPHVSPTTAVVSINGVDHRNIEAKQELFVDGKNQQKQREGEEEEEGEREEGEREEGEEDEREREEGEGEDVGGNCVKSSLKKEDSKEIQRKKVQWMDFLGKELVEIREFEASEIEDTDNDSEFSKGCVCTIL